MSNIDSNFFADRGTVLTAAKDLAFGDTIIVNLGKGTHPRIIDRAIHRQGTVEIVLFTESGRRPRFVLTESQKVELVPAESLAKVYA